MEKAIVLSKQNPDYFGIEWVLRAISKDESRYNLNYLSIEGTDAVGTDGHRLHNYYLVAPLEPGLYKPFVVSNQIVLIQTEGKEYPQWRQVIPKDPAQRTTLVNAGSNEYGLSASYSRLIRLMDEGAGLNLRYWQDILTFGVGYDVYYYGLDKPMVFVDRTHRAMIMPIVA